MTHGSLFSGIGGFDLAAEWAGWENVFHCEWNEFGQKVLKYHFPQSITYNDITKTDFTIHKGQIDVLTGGFPCQPYSSAGKRLGTADNRHLWPEMLRAIREIQPRWIVGENVRGLTNWNGGMVFDEVQLNLETEGYEVIPFLLPACAVNAPHRRDRIWFIAYANRYGSNKLNSNNEINTSKRRINAQCNFKQGFKNGFITNPNSDRLEGSISAKFNKQISSKKKYDEKCLSISKQKIQFENFPTKPPICGGNDGLSRSMDGITFSNWKKETIKAYGNAIVPQVALQIFNSINEYEKGH
jgi:DNA (cytosine-5)-methyltransferase 1